jgi:AcrR family transcriptional regulator
MAEESRRRPREEARKARNEVYRAHILEVAEAVFADRGFDSAKLQDISERAGLSMGTIYAIFPGKDELFRAILDEKGQELLGVVRAVVAQPAAPLDKLLALIAAYIDYFVAHPSFLRMHLRAGTSWVVSPEPDADSRARVWQEVHALQAQIFRDGIAAGVFVDEDPAYLARLFSAMDQVLLADWVGDGMRQGREELIARLERLVRRAFCRE